MFHHLLDMHHVHERPGMPMVSIDESKCQLSGCEELPAVRGILWCMDDNPVAQFWRHQLDCESDWFCRIENVIRLVVDRVDQRLGSDGAGFCLPKRDHFCNDSRGRTRSRPDFDRNSRTKDARNSCGKKNIRPREHA